MTQLYDRIGIGYRTHRHPDARIAAAIGQALGYRLVIAQRGSERWR